MKTLIWTMAIASSLWAQTKILTKASVALAEEQQGVFSIQKSNDAQALMQRLTGGKIPSGVQILNVSLKGHDGNVGLFNNFFPVNGMTIKDGIILTTGTVQSLARKNQQADYGIALGEPGDAFLSNISGLSSKDAVNFRIEFSTTTTIPGITFEFIFGSEEFPEYVKKQYNDVFAAVLDGKNITFDGNNNPITVDNNYFLLNNNKFNNSSPYGIEYDGLTPILQTSWALQAGTHVLEFKIADMGDGYYDSGVFLSNLIFGKGDEGTNLFDSTKVVVPVDTVVPPAPVVPVDTVVPPAPPVPPTPVVPVDTVVPPVPPTPVVPVDTVVPPLPPTPVIPVPEEPKDTTPDIVDSSETTVIIAPEILYPALAGSGHKYVDKNHDGKMDQIRISFLDSITKVALDSFQIHAYWTNAKKEKLTLSRKDFHVTVEGLELVLSVQPNVELQNAMTTLPLAESSQLDFQFGSDNTDMPIQVPMQDAMAPVAIRAELFLGDFQDTLAIGFSEPIIVDPLYDAKTLVGKIGSLANLADYRPELSTTKDHLIFVYDKPETEKRIFPGQFAQVWKGACDASENCISVESELLKIQGIAPILFHQVTMGQLDAREDKDVKSEVHARIMDAEEMKYAMKKSISPDTYIQVIQSNEDLKVRMEIFTSNGEYVSMHTLTIPACTDRSEGECLKDNQAVQLSWNMKSAQGRAVAAGVYLLRVRWQAGNNYGTQLQKIGVMRKNKH